MADSRTIELLCRNAALEVELRMVKELLAQARQSTQYLLQLLSGSTPNLGASTIGDSRVQPQLEASSWTKVSRRDSVVDTLSTAAAVDASSEYTADAQLVTFDAEKPLLDHGVEETLSNTPSLVPVKVDKSREPAQEHIGLGIVSDDSTPSTDFSFSTQATGGFRIRNNDGTSTWVSTSTPETSFSGMPAPRSLPFTGNEHRSLAGKATYWVDMSAEQLTEVIARYARGDARHTAEEYRDYFEEVIRPEYEEKMKRLQATRGALLAPFSEQQTEETPRGRTLSRQHVEEELTAKVKFSAAQAGEQAGEQAEEQAGEQAGDGGEPSERGEVAQVAETPLDNAQAATSSQQLPNDVQESVSGTMPKTREEAKLSTLENYQLPLLNLGAAAKGIGTEVDIPAEARLDEGVPATDPETSIGGYVPPRLYNPSALDDAKSLQAEFQGSGSGRARRPRERSYPELMSSRHAAPGEGPGLAAKELSTAEVANRPPYQNCSYITYPMEVEELFATPAEGDRSPYRTVLISNIPAGSMLIDVLDSIKGGRIYSAILLDTAGMRTSPPISTNSALITFVFGRHARFAAKNWSDTKLNTTAQLLQTISRPLPAHVMSDIHEHSLSRVLFVYDSQRVLPSPDKVAEELMRIGAQHPLKSEYDAEVSGLMLFHYASMAEAKAAWLACSRDRAFFGDIVRGFFADPCGTPLEKAEAQDEAGGNAHEQVKSEDDQVEANYVVGPASGVVDLNKIENWDPKWGFGINSGTEHSRMYEG